MSDTAMFSVEERNYLDQARRALLTAGQPSKLAVLDELESFQREAPMVAVIGETRTGKSTLVNAISRIPDLLPVQVDAVTAVPAVVTALQPGEEPSARASCIHLGEEELSNHTLSFDETHLWIRGDSQCTHEQISRDDRIPIEVKIAVDLSHLGNLTILDTPGLGRHQQLAQQAAASAHAVLMAVSAHSPLTETELRFLDKAAERTGMVVFCLTKCDQVSPSHRTEILAANKQILSTQWGSRFTAEFFEVSGLWGVEALDWTATAGDGALPEPRPITDDQLWDESGLPQLSEWLANAVAGNAQSLRRRAVLGFAAEGVMEDAKRKKAAAELANAGPEAEAQIQAKITTARKRLEEDVPALKAAVKEAVDRLTKRLKAELSRDVRRVVIDVRDRHIVQLESRTHKGKWDDESLNSLVDRFGEDLSDGSFALLSDYLSGLDEAMAVFTKEIGNVELDDPGKPPGLDLGAPPLPPDVFDPVLLMSGSSPVFLSNMLLGAILGSAALPAGVIAGGFLVTYLRRSRRVVTVKMTFKQWLVQEAGSATALIREDIARMVHERIGQVNQAVNAAIADETERLNADIAASDQARKRALSEIQTQEVEHLESLAKLLEGLARV